MTITFSQFPKSTPAARILGHGFLSSMLVETPEGWRPVGGLAVGDRLMTASHGAMTLQAVERSLRPVGGTWVMHLPPGPLGNRAPLHLVPGQRVLVECDAALPYCGGTRALLPALALEGWHGVEPHVPLFPEALMQLRLAHPALIHAGPGLWLACSGSLANPVAADLDAPAELSLSAARQLVSSLMCQAA